MATNKGPMWAVTDKNATVLKPNSSEIQPRVHDGGPGGRVELYADRATPGAEKYARLFLKDPSFIVFDAEGNEVRGLDEMQVQRIAPQAALPPDRVIADITELTDAALLTRCMVHPKATDLPPSPDRALMIDFLMGIFQASAARAGGSDDRLLTDDGNAGGALDPAADAFRVLEGA